MGNFAAMLAGTFRSRKLLGVPFTGAVHNAAICIGNWSFRLSGRSRPTVVGFVAPFGVFGTALFVGLEVPSGVLTAAGLFWAAT